MKTVKFFISGVCVVLIAFLLSSCSGHSDSVSTATTGGSSTTTTTTSATTGTITGTISLPANTNAKFFEKKSFFFAQFFSSPAHAATITDLTTLTVKAGNSTTNPDAAGKYTLTVTAGTNVEVDVISPSGNIVLIAIISSVTAGTTAAQNVDSTTTAVALMWLQNKSLTLSQIQSLSTFTNVKNAVETALTDSTVDSIVTSTTVTSTAQTAVTPALTSITLSPSSATVISGATQTFNATGVDQFGSAISFTPTFSVSPSDIGTITSSGVFTAAKKGSGIITVTGGSNITASATVTVTTGALNSLVISPTSVTLYKGDMQQFTVYGVDASGNAKVEKFITVSSPSWSVVGSIGTIDTSGVFTASAQGTGQVKAETTKSDGTAVSVTADVTVSNRTPSVSSVSAGASNLVVGAITTISATATDADNDTLSYAWSATGGTISGTGSSVTYTAPSTSGTYTITVVVTDGQGGSASKTVNVSVTKNPTISSGPTATPSSILTGASSTISVTSSDPDGDTLSYSWSATGGTISGTTSSVTYTAPTSAGTYVISVTVSDSKGGSATGSVDVTVTAPAVPSAPTGISATAGNAQATISWNAVSGTTSYNLYMAEQSGVTKSNYSSKTGGMAHTGVTSPYTHTSLTNGTTYYFVVTTVDTNGESAESSEVSATPSAGTANQSPAISSGPTASPSSITTSSTSTISVTASDPDGDTLSYSWSVTGGSASGTISGTTSSVTYTAPSSAGTYTVNVTVSDGKGGTASGSVNVTVITSNQYPVISSGPSANPTTVIVCGTSNISITATDANGDVLNYTWSTNGGTISGTGASVTYKAPETAGTYTVFVNIIDGHGGSTNGSVNVTVIVPSKPAQKIAAGESHTCAVLADGIVKCWGEGNVGQLGNGTNTASTSPVSISGISMAVDVSVGINYSCELLSDGTIKCWGYNFSGQLGNGTNTTSNTPVTVSGINTATAISAGEAHACALLSGGSIKCWGRNDLGQLGNSTNTDSNTPVSVSGITNATSISAGGLHTCALLTDKSVKCWGYNATGQLGNGATTNSNIPVSVNGISTANAIASGGMHSCALLSDGTVKCWGTNSDGELGTPFMSSCGNSSYCTTPIQVEVINSATAISSRSGSHTCALLTDKTIKCWGYNYSGELGNGSAGTHENTPVSVTGISNATDISAGGNRLGYGHTCAILSDGTVRCWGDNQSGQLGIGTNTGPQICANRACSIAPTCVSTTLYAQMSLFKKYFFAFADFVKNVFWN